MRAVIIAGGIGSRLRPITYSIPKPIVPLFNKPFLLYQVEMLKENGIKEIILNTHYLHANIKDILKDGSDYDSKFFYSYEEKPMGTAGAVKLAEEHFNDQPLVILNGDILTNVNLKEMIKFHQEKKADLTIYLTKVKDPTAYGLVFTDEKDNRVQQFLEKPSLDEATVNTVNAGIYIINPELFKLVPQNEPYSFERGLFPLMLHLGKKVFGFVSDSYWLDIGTSKKYMQAHHDALLGRLKLNIPGKKIKENVWMGENVDIDNSATIQGPVFIGNNSRIRKNAFIEEFSVIGEQVIIDDRTQINKSIIFSNTFIGENSTINESIINRNCHIESDCTVNNAVLAEGSKLGRGSII